MNPVVYTCCVLPHQMLKPYIRHYAIRCFDTQGSVFPKAIIATGDIEINFFIKDDFYIKNRSHLFLYSRQRCGFVVKIIDSCYNTYEEAENV